MAAGGRRVVPAALSSALADVAAVVIAVFVVRIDDVVVVVVVVRSRHYDFGNSQGQEAIGGGGRIPLNFVGDMEDDVREMRSSLLLALEARTAAGHARGLLGVAFSIVLVARVLSAASSLLSGPVDRRRRSSSSSRCDPLTSVLLLLVGRNYIVGTEQYERFSRMTSLVLAAALASSQVRSHAIWHR